MVSKEGSVVVFDRAATSMHALIHVVEQQPRFARWVAGWLNGGNLPYLLLGSSGGSSPSIFALGGEDMDHLLTDVLEDAASRLSGDSQDRSTASAVDEELSHQVAEAWSEIVVAWFAVSATKRTPRFRTPDTPAEVRGSTQPLTAA